jgi:hypothetical protein
MRDLEKAKTLQKASSQLSNPFRMGILSWYKYIKLSKLEAAFRLAPPLEKPYHKS